jgi:hypothetical protein
MSDSDPDLDAEHGAGLEPARQTLISHLSTLTLMPKPSPLLARMHLELTRKLPLTLTLTLTLVRKLKLSRICELSGPHPEP